MRYFERNIQFGRGGDLRKQACRLGLPPVKASPFPIALQLNPGQHLDTEYLAWWGSYFYPH